MVHSEVYLNKYVVSIAPFSKPACPDCSQNIQNTAVFCMFSLFTFHPFFRGVSWPHLPLCADAHACVICYCYHHSTLQMSVHALHILDNLLSSKIFETGDDTRYSARLLDTVIAPHQTWSQRQFFFKIQRTVTVRSSVIDIGRYFSTYFTCRRGIV